MRITIVTILPEIFKSLLEVSMIKRALEKGIVKIELIDLRKFTHDRHQTVDDRPYGGGPGMVMKPEPFFEAVDSIIGDHSHKILLSPQGKLLNQRIVKGLTSHSHLILLCGHYEGVDERVREGLADEEVSIGDYILTNGNIASLVLIDSVIRLLPGVLGSDQSIIEESFSENLLEYPQYTRPEKYRDMKVPDILLSGNHEEIKTWRKVQATKRTKDRRPDLLP